MQKNILFFLLLIAVVIAVPRQDHGSESIVMDVDAQMEEFTYHTDNSALSEESKGTNTTGSDTLLMDPRFLVSAASQDESTGESTYPLFQKQQEMTIKSGPLEGDSVPDNIQEEMPESIPQRQTSEDSPEGKAEASIQPEIYDPVTEAHDTAEGGRGENELQDEAQIEVRESNAYTKPIDAVDEQDGNELISEALMDKIRAIETVPQVVDYRNDTEALGTEMVREPAEEPTSAENLGGTKAENLQKTADEILLKKPTSQPDYPQNRTDVQEVEVEETTNETELIPTKADLPVSVTEQHITEVEQKGLQEISMKAETSAFVSEANEMTTGQPEIPESSTQETVQRIPVESTLQSTDADLQTGLTERGTGETTVQPQDSEASSDETESIVDVTPSQTDTQLVDVNSWKEPTDVKFDDSETQGKATGTSSIEESMEDASDFSIPERRTTPKAEAGVGAGDIRKPSSSPMFESSTLLSVKHPTENEVAGAESEEVDAVAQTKTQSEDSVDASEQTSNGNAASAEEGTSQPDIAVTKVSTEITADKYDISGKTVNTTTTTLDGGSSENEALYVMEKIRMLLMQDYSSDAPSTTSWSSTLRIPFSMASFLILFQILLLV